MNLSLDDRIGRCYELSYNYIMQSNDPELLLVHGVLKEPYGGDRSINHAWIETGGNVFDPVMDWTIPKEAYYALFKITVEKRYNREQVADISLKYMHKGPWHSVDSNNDRVGPRD